MSILISCRIILIIRTILVCIHVCDGRVVARERGKFADVLALFFFQESYVELQLRSRSCFQDNTFYLLAGG